MSIFDTLAKMVGGVLQESMMDQIRIESMEDDTTLVMKDGSLISMLNVAGAVRTPGEEDLAEMVEQLRIMMASYFAKPGHAIEVNFMRDASAAKRYIERVVERTKRSARTLDLDLDDVLQERVSNLSTKMVSETCLITVTTRPSVLDREELKEDVAGVAKRLSGMPYMEYGQVPGKAMTSCHARHGALVEALNSALVKVGQMSRVLSVREALQEIRAGLYPDTYSIKDEWNPILPAWSKANQETPQVHPGKRALNMAPETPGQMAAMEYSNLGVPTFDMQLATEDSFVDTTRTVRIGNMVFAGFDMTLAPEVLPDFNSLVADITAKGMDIPWRASMRIESGGVQAQSLKMMYLSIFTWAAATHNKRIREALLINSELDGKEDNVVRFRMSFSTWGAGRKVRTASQECADRHRRGEALGQLRGRRDLGGPHGHRHVDHARRHPGLDCPRRLRAHEGCAFDDAARPPGIPLGFRRGPLPDQIGKALAIPARLLQAEHLGFADRRHSRFGQIRAHERRELRLGDRAQCGLRRQAGAAAYRDHRYWQFFGRHRLALARGASGGSTA